METGSSLWTADELAAEMEREAQQKKEYEAKLAAGFFQDGNTRKVVITDIKKEDKVSQKGNNYVLHTYLLEDVTTMEREEVVDRNFALTNALSPVKKELGLDFRCGTTVLSLTTHKDGEREWQGVNYPVWRHEVSVDSNPGVAAKTEAVF